MVWFQTAYAIGLPLIFVGMDQLSKSLFVYFDTKYRMFVCALHSDYHKLFFYFLRHEYEYLDIVNIFVFDDTFQS